MSKKNKTATTKAPKPPTSSVKPTGRAKLVAQLERVAFRVSNLSKRLRDSDSEEEMRDALLEIGRKLQPVIEAASELPDNWGARTMYYFNAQNGRLQEQFYTLYRDMRSWTGAVTFRVVDNAGGTPDFTISFALSLKASPSTQVGEDVVNPHRLVGE